MAELKVGSAGIIIVLKEIPIKESNLGKLQNFPDELIQKIFFSDNPRPFMQGEKDCHYLINKKMYQLIRKNRIEFNNLNLSIILSDLFENLISLKKIKQEKKLSREEEIPNKEEKAHPLFKDLNLVFESYITLQHLEETPIKQYELKKEKLQETISESFPKLEDTANTLAQLGDFKQIKDMIEKLLAIKQDHTWPVKPKIKNLIVKTRLNHIVEAIKVGHWEIAIEFFDKILDWCFKYNIVSNKHINFIFFHIHTLLTEHGQQVNNIQFSKKFLDKFKDFYHAEINNLIFVELAEKVRDKGSLFFTINLAQYSLISFDRCIVINTDDYSAEITDEQDLNVISNKNEFELIVNADQYKLIFDSVNKCEIVLSKDKNKFILTNKNKNKKLILAILVINLANYDHTIALKLIASEKDQDFKNHICSELVKLFLEKNDPDVADLFKQHISDEAI